MGKIGEWADPNQLEDRTLVNELCVKVQLIIKGSNWQVKHWQMAFCLPNFSHTKFFHVWCMDTNEHKIPENFEKYA